jgi:hypothetical protein
MVVDGYAGDAARPLTLESLVPVLESLESSTLSQLSLSLATVAFRPAFAWSCLTGIEAMRCGMLVPRIRATNTNVSKTRLHGTLPSFVE